MSCWQGPFDFRCWNHFNGSLEAFDVNGSYDEALNCSGVDWYKGLTCNYSLKSSDFAYCGNISCYWRANDTYSINESNDTALLLMEDVDTSGMVNREGITAYFMLFLLCIVGGMIILGFKYRSFYFLSAGIICIFIGYIALSQGIFVVKGEAGIKFVCQTCSGLVEVYGDSWEKIPYNFYIGLFYDLVGLFLIIYGVFRFKNSKPVTPD